MPRVWPAPSESHLIHFIGDTHFGGLSSVRADKVLADLANPLVPTPVAHVQVGDVVETGLASEDVTALAWLNQLDANWYAACGNHDVWRDGRTVAAWATAYGYSSKNYTVDLGFATLIVVGPDSMGYPPQQTRITLSAATLAWLDATLLAATKHCLIVCHAPLKDTVVGDIANVWSSAEIDFYAHPDPDIRTILGNHQLAKMWISGHTHSPITTSGFTTTSVCGTRSVACVNASALHYTGRTFEWNDDLYTLYMNYRGDVAEIRYRNHGAGAWLGPNGDLVTEIQID